MAPVATTGPIEPVVLEPDADPLGPLFDDADLPRAPERTRHRREVERTRRVLALGYHPAAIAFRASVRLHPDAPPVDDREAPGPRCGDCAFRQLVTLEMGRRGKPKQKCRVPEPAPHGWRPAPNEGPISAGRGPDIPSWWPGCSYFRPAPTPDDDAAPAAEGDETT